MTTTEHAQSWDPNRYARNARFVSELGRPVVDLLAPRPGERILDIGCGDGALTEVLLDSGAHVVGIDASGEQVAAAKARGLDAHVMDACALDIDSPFHAVFTNAALHWVRDHDAVVAGVARCLQPGGRFVGEMGGAGNAATVRKALGSALARRGIDAEAADPWYFSTPEEFSDVLTAAGFEVRHMELFPRPTPLPGHMDGWLETFAEAFLRQVPADERPILCAEIAADLDPALRTQDGGWFVDYVRLRFEAVRTE